MQKSNLYGHFIPYANVNSEWIMSLNVRAETLKVPEENNGDITCDLG